MWIKMVHRHDASVSAALTLKNWEDNWKKTLFISQINKYSMFQKIRDLRLALVFGEGQVIVIKIKQKKKLH